MNPGQTAFTVLAAISFCHFLNDMMQALLPAMYPMLKQDFGLDFGQVGLITFTFQLTASLLQPVIGIYTGREDNIFWRRSEEGRIEAAGAKALCRTRSWRG